MAFKTDNPYECGIFNISKTGEIISFEEKPKEPNSNIANAAIYVFKKEVLNLIKSQKLKDISTELVPKSFKNASLWIYNGNFFDIGNIGSLKRANKISINIKMPQPIEWHKKYTDNYVCHINKMITNET